MKRSSSPWGIGDKQPGASKITFATLDPYKADSPLLESGLRGPVQIATSSSRPMK
jgi:hypothetical protein